MNYTRTSIGNVPAVDADGNKRPTVHVNKGEKSFPVFLTTFTVVNNDTKEKIKYEEYKKLSADEQSKYTVFPHWWRSTMALTLTSRRTARLT